MEPLAALSPQEPRRGRAEARPRMGSPQWARPVSNSSGLDGAKAPPDDSHHGHLSAPLRDGLKAFCPAVAAASGSAPGRPTGPRRRGAAPPARAGAPPPGPRNASGRAPGQGTRPAHGRAGRQGVTAIFSRRIQIPWRSWTWVWMRPSPLPV